MLAYILSAILVLIIAWSLAYFIIKQIQIPSKRKKNNNKSNSSKVGNNLHKNLAN